MSIVSNASPLINLARIGKLNLLRQLYGGLTIPNAVWQEVVFEGAGQPGADEVEAATWIKSQAVTNRELVRALQQELDAGEAEAIALALEIGAELLLMDERLGRNCPSSGFALHRADRHPHRSQAQGSRRCSKASTGCIAQPGWLSRERRALRASVTG